MGFIKDFVKWEYRFIVLLFAYILWGLGVRYEGVEKALDRGWKVW